MNIDELLKMGAAVFSKSNLSGDAGSNLNVSSLVSALSGLTGGDGGFNFGALMKNMDAGGLANIAKSWLSDGANETVSPEQITSAIGSGKIAEFASKLGISEKEAAGGLSEALPQMMDKASSGGTFLDSIGGVEGALGFASKLFGK